MRVLALILLLCLVFIPSGSCGIGVEGTVVSNCQLGGDYDSLDYVPATMEILIATTNAGRFYKLTIYQSDKALIGVADAKEAVAGVQSSPISGCRALIPGETIVPQCVVSAYITHKGQGSTFIEDATGTYASPPNPSNFGTAGGQYPAIRIKNAAGQILVGESDWSAYTTNDTMNPNKSYGKPGGYTCNDLS